MAISLNAGMAIAGGTAPMVATYLAERLGMPVAPAWYVAGLAVISMIAVFSTKHRNSAPLITAAFEK